MTPKSFISSVILVSICVVATIRIAVAVNETEPCECVPSNNQMEPNEYIVKCNRRKLTAMPLIKCNGQVHTLDMRGNFLTEIHLLDGGTNLKVLYLSINKIYKIEPEAFESVPQLEELYINNNDLETLQPHVFYDLKNLKVLDLSNNRLTRIDSDIFQSQSKLQELKLSGNPLRYLDVNQFQKLTSIKYLHLCNIQSHHLPAGIFHDLRYLEMVDLSDNEFDEVPIDALRSAPTLKELRFNNNPIKKLGDNSFNKLTYLETLHISENRKLQYIGRSTFSTLVSLKRLYIESNPMLTGINSGAFDDPYDPTHSKTSFALQEFHLKQNSLTTLSKDLLHWSSVAVLDVRGNPWYCTCELDWLRVKLISQEQGEVANVKCAGPSKLRAMELADLGQDDLVCDTDHESNGKDVILWTFMVIMMVTVTVFTISILLVLIKKKKLCSRRFYKRGAGAVYYVKAHTNPIDTAADI